MQIPLRPVLSSAFVVLSTTVCGGTAVLTSFLPRRRFFEPIARAWARSITRFAGVDLQVQGQDNVQEEGPYLFMVNHQSHLDTLCLVPFMPPGWSFVAKQSLRRIPFLGWSMAANGMVFIDRSNHDKAVASLDRAAERIRQGVSVIMYPEGTRTRDGALQPFKKGPFHLAAAARVPIVPIVIHGTRPLLPPGRLGIRPGPVTMRIGRPIPVDADATPASLSEAVHRAMEEMLAAGGQ